jgi:hypothetical protein
MAPEKGITMSSQVETARHMARQFCLEFVKTPYLCYTEHGQHALFYTRLYNALPPSQRYTTWYDHKVCVVQKEYPTAGPLGKPRRQHWDIAVIKTPPESLANSLAASYDYLRLAAVVEFGMNEDIEHLIDDIERLSHADANVDQGFVIHLHRLSQPGAKLSKRDWSAASKRIVSKESVVQMSVGKPVEIYYGMYDSTGNYPWGVWLIRDGAIEPVSE